jgi:hypothetical protein
VKSTNYEAPRYVVFTTLLSLHPSLAQIFSSTPCSQTPSAEAEVSEENVCGKNTFCKVTDEEM